MSFKNVSKNLRHPEMRPWTRRWIVTWRLARTTSTRCDIPRRPAWST